SLGGEALGHLGGGARELDHLGHAAHGDAAKISFTDAASMLDEPGQRAGDQDDDHDPDRDEHGAGEDREPERLAREILLVALEGELLEDPPALASEAEDLEIFADLVHPPLALDGER